jgi:small subunit ribosomal protein S10
VVERWVRYLRKHGIGGVGMRVVRWERTPLGIGRRKLEDVGTQLEAAREEAAKGAEIKKLGENIIKHEIHN